MTSDADVPNDSRIDSLQEGQESDDGDGEETILRLNTVEELRNGIIKTNQNNMNEYTILLVGETGTGKTTFLSLIANILAGYGPKQYVVIHDEGNEAGGARNQSQTNSAKVYEFISNNAVRLRIVDTPGLVDTRGIAQDELHKASITQAIKDNISSVNAVLILANGTVERLGAATDYALSTLSSIFPRTLADNIGILFTNVASPLSWNFDQDSLPDGLKGTKNNQFLLDNPLAMWKKLNVLRSQRKTNKRVLAELESAVNEGHNKALREFALLFDWLDTLTPQPTRDIVTLYEQSQEIERNIANALSRASQLGEKKTKLTEIKQSVEGSKMTMEQYENYRNVTTRKVWEQVETQTFNMICCHPQCYINCHIGREPMPLFHVITQILRLFNIMHPCHTCGHPLLHHRTCQSLWEERDAVDVVVDEDAKQKFDEAKQQNDEHRGTMDDLDHDIARLDNDMEETLASIGRLTESYANLSLMGSFAGQVKKSLRLLEVNLEAMRNNKADMRSIELVEQSLESMKRKLRMVEEASEKAGMNVGRMRKIKKTAGQLVNSSLATLANIENDIMNGKLLTLTL
ncbi:hypothetical protein APHAL10511_000444 [Amanita phalloides]|nr:hypothetical protein APHAL10511_000444 [Amanita phalloides]